MNDLSYAVDALTAEIERGHRCAAELRKARELVLRAAMGRPARPWWAFWRKS